MMRTKKVNTINILREVLMTWVTWGWSFLVAYTPSFSLSSYSATALTLLIVSIFPMTSLPVVHWSGTSWLWDIETTKKIRNKKILFAGHQLTISTWKWNFVSIIDINGPESATLKLLPCENGIEPDLMYVNIKYVTIKFGILFHY